MKLVTLIVATFRELFSKATLYILIGISTLIMLGTLAAVSSERTGEGAILKVFGNPVGAAVPHDQFDQLVHGMQAGLAKGLFFGIMLFGVFATAGVIPESLEKGTVDLYLSKPIARWELLLGKYAGAVAVIGAVIVYFLGGVWLGIGIRTGVWNVQFLLSALPMIFMFACIFSIVLFLGVVFRNAAVPIIGCFLYLALIDNLLDSRETGLFMISENVIYRSALDGLYYMLPQIASMQRGLANLVLHNSIEWKHFAQAFLSSSAIFGAAIAIMQRKDF